MEKLLTVMVMMDSDVVKLFTTYASIARRVPQLPDSPSSIPKNLICITLYTYYHDEAYTNLAESESKHNQSMSRYLE